MSLVNIGAEWEYHGITDEDDCADWMVEKMNRGRRQRERGDKQPELRGHFWKLQRRMINAFVNDFTPKHKELLKKYWKMTANSCDYNVCAYKLRHPSAKIIYGAMGFGDEVKYALFDNNSDDRRDYDMSVLLKKQFPNDYDKCNMIYKWVVSEANMMVNRFPKPIPVPKKKKRKRKSQRRRQKENKLKKKCDASHLIHTGTHRREATTNIKIIN